MCQRLTLRHGNYYWIIIIIKCGQTGIKSAAFARRAFCKSFFTHTTFTFLFNIFFSVDKFQALKNTSRKYSHFFRNNYFTETWWWWWGGLDEQMSTFLFGYLHIFTYVWHSSLTPTTIIWGFSYSYICVRQIRQGS